MSKIQKLKSSMIVVHSPIYMVTIHPNSIHIELSLVKYLKKCNCCKLTFTNRDAKIRRQHNFLFSWNQAVQTLLVANKGTDNKHAGLGDMGWD